MFAIRNSLNIAYLETNGKNNNFIQEADYGYDGRGRKDFYPKAVIQTKCKQNLKCQINNQKHNIFS